MYDRCGLVALAMASKEYTKPVPVGQLLAEARVRGFTQHGEVYSVDFMSTLAAEHLPDHRPEILVDLQNCPDAITHALAHAAMVLIPYDADFNHAPCLKRGHKAHWALLVGLISSRYSRRMVFCLFLFSNWRYEYWLESIFQTRLSRAGTSWQITTLGLLAVARSSREQWKSRGGGCGTSCWWLCYTKGRRWRSARPQRTCACSASLWLKAGLASKVYTLLVHQCFIENDWL